MPSSVPEPYGLEDHRPTSEAAFAQAQAPASGSDVLPQPPARATEAAKTLADGDQSTAAAEQPRANRDEISSGRPPSEDDLERGADRAPHDFTRDVRERRLQQRERTAELRVAEAARRDEAADARDLAAMARDQAAALRDVELVARDVAWASNGHPATGAEVLLRAGEFRRLAAADRLAALEYRVRAAADREQAAREREQAARDRAQAKTDRDVLLRQLMLAQGDTLPGMRTRVRGWAAIEREIDRTCRMSGLLVTAYVDVVGLRAVADSGGDAAGDDLLHEPLAVTGDRRRRHDLVIRVATRECPELARRDPSGDHA